MKKIAYLLSVICLVLSLGLQSCDDGEGYSIGDFTAPQLATVRTVSSSGFYLDCDVWGTCWPVNTNMGWYVPIDGQRVVVTFNPLWDNYGGFDHAVMILDMQDVLTRYVEPMSPDDEDEMGHEPVPTTADGVTIGNGYLNVWLSRRLPFTTTLRLVYPAADDSETETPAVGEDGYYHLELRCHTQAGADTPGTYSLVSYSLNALDFTGDVKGIRLKLDLEEGGEETLVFTLVQEDAGQSTVSAYR